MTTRFSLAELGDMLHVPVEMVRAAVDALEQELSGESFVYQERNWRIAPSDVKRIQMWIEGHYTDRFEQTESKPRRAKRIIVKKVDSSETAGE